MLSKITANMKLSSNNPGKLFLLFVESRRPIVISGILKRTVVKGDEEITPEKALYVR